jgi:NAD(P)-dependent dehydrogenase (short-subunit alcohol dehydrogenase family)
MAASLPGTLSAVGLKPDEFSGRVAVVTGAGRGIGREIARTLALLGGQVALAEISDEGQLAAEEICRSGGQAVFVRTDVSDEQSVSEMIRRVKESFGPVDLLINSAIVIGAAPVVEMETELWDRIMAVNLRGTFLTSRVCLPDMLASRRGTIVNLVSAEAMPMLSAYIASKQGIVAFSQSLAAEVGERGVRVIPFGPGMVDTPGLRSVSERLAPVLGLTPDQFIGASLHSAYDGAMPVADSAAAAAYLIARLADEYHGELVTAYEVLERAGYLKGAALEAPAREGDAPAETAEVQADDDQELAGLLQAMIVETAAEFERLPVFVRPIARRGFRAKSGHSLQEWQQLAGELAGLQGKPDFTVRLGALAGALARLSEYYRGVPAETAKMTRDQVFLAEVRRISAARMAVIERLLERANLGSR